MRFRPAFALVVFVGVAVLPLLARADIEFVGILATSHATRFVLSDTTTGKTEWVRTGDGFAGYVVASYEAKDDTLILRRGPEERRVRLKDDAKVKSSRFELTGSITFGASDKIEVERATLFLDQENVFPLKDGLTYRITPTRLPDGTIRYAISVERVFSPNKRETIAVPNIHARYGQPFSLQVDELAFAFTPK